LNDYAKIPITYSTTDGDAVKTYTVGYVYSSNLLELLHEQKIISDEVRR